MEWTREKTLSLIHEYRKRRGLWDMTHDDYRKKEMKQKLLVEVGSSLGGGISIVEIEKKFHTLRTQYHREINRMKRKEPYNSKWFGFKNLQFLSSPKACRSSKGRIKSEITEEGTVTTKFIVRDVVTQQDTDPCSVNSTNNISEEFITIHRKPAVAYQAIAGSSGGGTVAASTSRSQEFEKLIEETTKDVEEDTEEAKPKIIKEINVPMEQHSYNTQLNSGDDVAGEMVTGSEHDQMQHETHHHIQQQPMEEEEQQIETINIQAAEGEITYQTSGPAGIGPGGHTQTTPTTTIHHHALPARIFKIQRRDTCHEEDYYNDDNQQTSQHHIHAVPASAPKRIYYEANGQQHTATLLTTPATAAIQSQANINATLINPPAKVHTQLQSRAQSQQQLSSSPSQATTQQLRDEFSTYGEYVANEMRDITNREVLVALKHKINTALFEAHMAELQK